MNDHCQYANSITEDNPALEEGIHFIIPANQVSDEEMLNGLLQELGQYYEVKLKKTSTAIKVKCLNAIERDPLPDLSSLLEYLSRRKVKIRTLLEKYGFGETNVSLYFSHNCYCDFSLKPIQNMKAAEYRKPGLVIRRK